MMKLQSKHSPRRSPPVDGQRIRLTACTILYAGAIGAAAIPVTFLAKTDEVLREPERLPLIPLLIFSGTGAAAGMLLVWPLILWLTKDSSRPRGLLVWCIIGFGYGVLFPFLSGALLSLSAVLVELALGAIDSGELLSRMLDAVFRAPLNAVTHGAIGLLTGLIAGGIFGTGAWIIDTLNGSRNALISRYAPWSIALLLGFLALFISASASPDILARLG